MPDSRIRLVNELLNNTRAFSRYGRSTIDSIYVNPCVETTITPNNSSGLSVQIDPPEDRISKMFAELQAQIDELKSDNEYLKAIINEEFDRKVKNVRED